MTTTVEQVLEHLLDLTTIKLLGARIMADSENSRTLPPITKRNLLSITERVLEGMASGQGDSGNNDIDDAVTKWAAWWDVHRECARLCSIQQRLESELFRTAESPRVEVRVPNQASPMIADTPEEIDAWLEGEAFAELRERAKVELATRRQAWNVADETIGYSRAKAAEDIASAREQRLAEELWATSTGSVAAATAKLHCIIRTGEPEPDSGEFPWPQIRSALVDLLMTSAPDMFSTSRN